MITIITSSVDLNWNVGTLNLMNQLIKIHLSPQSCQVNEQKKSYYKTLGTSVLNSPMFPFKHINFSFFPIFSYMQWVFWIVYFFMHIFRVNLETISAKKKLFIFHPENNYFVSQTESKTTQSIIITFFFVGFTTF